MPDPDFAVLARTSVDCARIGALTTYARHPSSQHLTSVAVQAGDDGSVDVRLAPGALAARQLLARPLATLQVAPVGHEPVLLHGAARRLPGLSPDGRLVFHVQAAAVRVGNPSVVVDEATYAAAEPDPLRHDSPVVLRHLNDGHSDALAACLRAGGHDAAFAHATRLDAWGLTVLAVGDTGVHTVRLPFPTAVARLADLPVGLRCALNPRCGCTSSPAVDRFRQADGG